MVVVNSEDITLESVQGSLDTYLSIISKIHGGTDSEDSLTSVEEGGFDGSIDGEEADLWEVEEDEVEAQWDMEEDEEDHWEVEEDEVVSYEEDTYEEEDLWEVEEDEVVSYEEDTYEEEDPWEVDRGTNEETQEGSWGIEEEVEDLWEVEEGNDEEDPWEVLEEVSSTLGGTEEVEVDLVEPTVSSGEVEEVSNTAGGTSTLKTDVQFNKHLESEKASTVSANSSNIVEKVPTDLREFVRKNPNCEMSLALKYFSKKEIDRQLSLGRVFKRKNRLLV